MSTSLKKSSRVAVGVATVLATAATGQAWAADTSDLGEIVVTARKRDETFQNVPVTVNVFTEQQIQSAGIQKPGDFIAMVPNMQLVETQNAGTAFVVVRGVSQARNSEPSVAVLVDGVLESNPAQFDQGLNDIQQIEVLKGPQGALYGRSAIGGAILIKTRDPGDQTEGQAMVGYGNGNSTHAQLALGGPIDDAKTLKYRASLNFANSDGFLENSYLHQKADPSRDYSGRVRLTWKPSDSFSGDFRLAYDRLETRGFYYQTPRAAELNPFSSFTTTPDVNDTSTPITVNNPGVDNRDLITTSLKLDFQLGAGTVTSITAWDKTKEIITGDAYDFRPNSPCTFGPVGSTSIGGSVYNCLLAGTVGGTAYSYDLNQSQFLNIKTYSEELRFTSKAIGGFSWIGGAYFIHTDRFISTGNMLDTGAGVFPVYEQPRGNPSLPGANNSYTFLADTQKNDAWAAFADATYEVTSQFEIDAALRYDEDRRQNTTDTPDTPWCFDANNAANGLCPSVAGFMPLLPNGQAAAFTGEVRTHTWSKLQPKGTLRYKPVDNVTIYGGWSRGFRSGGFNQSGVGAVAVASNVLGVHDLFEGEVADTWEVGVKSQWLNHRLNVGLALYDTKSTNGYFFKYLVANSTQNLGNLNAEYKGGELELSAKASDNFDVYASFGYTDSKITAMEDPTVIGNQAPLVSRTTINAGVQYHQSIGNGLNAVARVDYQQIGRTWFDPYNLTSRNPVNLVDVRAGVDGGKWSVMAWSKNLGNEKYNTEYSPGTFLWKALPRRYGVDFSYKF
jgi:iron complex outermembrane receptor protein